MNAQIVQIGDRASLVRRGRRLEYFTIAYNSLEGLKLRRVGDDVNEGINLSQYFVCNRNGSTAGFCSAVFPTAARWSDTAVGRSQRQNRRARLLGHLVRELRERDSRVQQTGKGIFIARR